MTKTKTSSPTRDLQRLAAIGAECKALYTEADALEERLIPLLKKLPKKNPLVVLSNGKAARLKNNFVDRNGAPKNKTFKTTFAKIWEIEFFDLDVAG